MGNYYEYKARQAAKTTSKTQTPSEYRAATAAKSAAEIKAGQLITSSGERAVGIDRTKQALAALKTGTTSGTRVLTPITAFSSTSGMLGAVSSNAKLSTSQQAALTNLLVSQSGTKTTSATQAEKDKLRVILGKGYVAPGPVTDKFLQDKLQATAMRKALAEDLALRIERINARETELNRQQSQLSSAERKLQSYNKYIENGKFTGNQAQYKAYVSSYNAYEKAYNNYSSTLELQNVDVTTYNKNLDSYDKKASKYTKKKQKLEAKIQKVLAAKIGTPEQVANKLTKTLNNAYNVQSIAITSKVPKNSQAYKDWEKTMKRTLTQADINNYAKFYGGVYKSVYDQPLKAVSTAALFFVGAPILKGVSSGIKAIALGSKAGKTRQAAVYAMGKAVEAGLISLYVVPTGIRYVVAEDVAEYGYITGDVLFNEILPAGVGAHFGIRVVNRLPKTAMRIRGTGTKVKKGVTELAKSEKAEIGYKTKQEATFKKEFDDILKRTEENAIKKAQQDAGRKLTSTEINNIKRSILKNKKAEIEAIARKTKRDRARAEDTLANSISNQFKKQRATSAKETFESKTETLKGNAAAPTITNITKQTENLIKKAIRLQQKYEAGSISKATYDRQVSNIYKQAKEIEELKKYAIELGKKPSDVPSTKAISSSIKSTKTLMSTSSKAGIFSISQTAVNSIVKTSLIGKELTKTKSMQFTKAKLATKPHTTTQLQPYTKTISKLSTTINKAPVTKTSTATKPSRPKAPTTKAKEKTPEVIIPKLASITSSIKKKKPTRRTKRSTSKQLNVNAVATFKDLLK